MMGEEERRRKKKELFLFLFSAYNRWWSWPTHTNTTSSRFTSTNFFSIKSILIAIFKETKINMNFFLDNCCLKLNYLICGSNETSSEKKKKKFKLRVRFIHCFFSWEIST
jgi:hypothetical protein